MKFFPYVQLFIVALLSFPSMYVVYMKPDVALIVIIILGITSFTIWKIGETIARSEKKPHDSDCDCTLCEPEYCDGCNRDLVNCNCDDDDDDDEVCDDCGFRECECELDNTCGRCGEDECECDEPVGEMCEICSYPLDECECETVEVCAQCELEPHDCKCESCEECQEFMTDCECEDKNEQTPKKASEEEFNRFGSIGSKIKK